MGDVDISAEAAITVPRELFSRIYDTLAFYANKCSYDPPRIGGVLQGCPRGPAPTPSQLAFWARMMMRTIDVDLLKRDGKSWPTDDVEPPTELSAELIAARARITALESLNATRNQQNAAAWAEVDRLRELLRKHWQHSDACKERTAFGSCLRPKQGQDCTCGLDAAIAPQVKAS